MRGKKKMKTALTDYYRSYTNAIYEDSDFRRYILGLQTSKLFDEAHQLGEKELFKKILDNLLEEAELTLSLISSQHITKTDSVLEVGGGLGLVYGFLKRQGYDIWGIEPSDSGFGGYFQAALQLFKMLGIDGSHFHPLSAKEATKLDARFDVIFSNNVLEHIPELEESISDLQKVLNPNGVMIHNTVNYLIPYEPHFKILLFPFFPRCTEFFKPVLKESPLWKGLNFITTYKLKRVCIANNLTIRFDTDRLLRTFTRLDTDPEFAKRQKYFIPIYMFLKSTGLIKFLDKIPIACTTPITFIYWSTFWVFGILKERHCKTMCN